MSLPSQPIVLAAVAHPDDIELLFSGTLLLLKQVGCSIHMWNLADGSCGTQYHPSEEIIRLRAEEARRSADLAGAQLHPALFPDLEVFYDKPSLAAVSAIIRAIRPQIILTHSASDYMEDHQNVCRLITTAAFSRAMPNYHSIPPQPPYADPVRIYHGSPHGLADGMGKFFCPDFLVNIAPAMETKCRMLACHESQFVWLSDSQGMEAPIEEMRQMARDIASWGDGLEYAEAWRRHAHLGFCSPDFDPLSELLRSSLHQPKTTS